MNRQERRASEREIQKHTKTINSLSKNEVLLVDAMVKEKVNIETNKLHKNIFIYLGYALMKNFIDEDVSIDIVEELGELIKRNNIKEIEREFADMASSKDLLVKFYNENPKLIRREAIDKALEVFTAIPKSTIIKYYDEWARSRAKNNNPVKEEIDPDVEEAMEKVSEILDANNDDESKRVLEEAEKLNGETNINIVSPEEEKPSLLKVAEMHLVLKSDENTYTLSADKMLLEVAGNKYQVKSEDDYSKYVTEVNKYYNKLLDEAKEAYVTWETKCRRIE